MLTSKKAFTLVELLAVIIILGIILVLAVPRVATMITNYRDKAAIEQEKLIEAAAEKYFIFEEPDLTWDNDTTTIKVSVLQTAGYLKTGLTNPRTKADISNLNIILTKELSGDVTAEITLPSS